MNVSLENRAVTGIVLMHGISFEQAHEAWCCMSFNFLIFGCKASDGEL